MKKGEAEEDAKNVLTRENRAAAHQEKDEISTGWVWNVRRVRGDWRD